MTGSRARQTQRFRAERQQDQFDYDGDEAVMSSRDVANVRKSSLKDLISQASELTCDSKIISIPFT